MSRQQTVKSRQGYKKTEIGEIPKGWEVVKFNRCFKKRKVEVGNIPKQNYKSSGLYPVIDQGANFIAGYTDDENKIYKGDLPVIIFGDHTRFFKYVDFPFVTGADGTKILLPDRDLYDPKYLYYSLENLRVESLGYSRHFKLLKEKFLPLPPLPEQRKIAEILSTVDEVIQRTDEIIDKTQELKKGLMQQLLTRGIGHTRFKQTEIGEIPEDWEVVRLREVTARFISGGTPSTSRAEYWNGKIPWMRSAYIEGRFVDSGEKYISEEGLENSATNVVPGGNILVATRVCIGNVAMNKVDIAISQDLTGVVVDKGKINPEYLYWILLNSENTLKSWIQGSTIKGVLRNDLQNLKLPLLSLSEQQKIAEIFSAVDDKIEVERKRKKKLQELKKGLMQVLLTGKVRVKV